MLDRAKLTCQYRTGSGFTHEIFEAVVEHDVFESIDARQGNQDRVITTVIDQPECNVGKGALGTRECTAERHEYHGNVRPTTYPTRVGKVEQQLWDHETPC